MKKNSLENWQGTICVIGLDWGDSGKGRLIDDLGSRAQIVARYSGGSNTGHTVTNHFGKFALHIVPSGIFNPKAVCLVGRGVAVDLESLIDDEMLKLKRASVPFKNLFIDEQASLTMPWHKLRDNLREKYRENKIGTTGRGAGPTYADRVERVGLRVKDLCNKNFKKILKEELDFQSRFFNLKLSFPSIFSKYRQFAKIIKPHVTQTIPIIKKAIVGGKNVLFEGTQGWLLDIDAGTYPFVTSSNPGVIGIWRSFDLHPTAINKVIGITKVYTTRVGAGPMPTKIKGPQRAIIISKGQEFGTTSGRTRDPGWLDLVAISAAIKANKVTTIALSKLDVLSGFKKIKIGVAYKKDGKYVDYVSGDADFLDACQPVYEELAGWSEDLRNIRSFQKLPQNARSFIRRVEKFLSVPISFISVGPKRGEVIYV